MARYSIPSFSSLWQKHETLYVGIWSAYGTSTSGVPQIKNRIHIRYKSLLRLTQRQPQHSLYILPVHRPASLVSLYGRHCILTSQVSGLAYAKFRVIRSKIGAMDQRLMAAQLFHFAIVVTAFFVSAKRAKAPMFV